MQQASSLLTKQRMISKTVMLVLGLGLALRPADGGLGLGL